MHKPLVSVHEMAKRGNNIAMDSEYSYVLNKATGIKTELVVKNGVYTFPVWLDPAEQHNEELMLSLMEDVAPKEEQTMPAPSFQRRAGWP